MKIAIWGTWKTHPIWEKQKLFRLLEDVSAGRKEFGEMDLSTPPAAPAGVKLSTDTQRIHWIYLVGYFGFNVKSLSIMHRGTFGAK